MFNIVWHIIAHTCIHQDHRCFSMSVLSVWSGSNWPWQDMYLIIVLTARNITMAEPTKNRSAWHFVFCNIQIGSNWSEVSLGLNGPSFNCWAPMKHHMVTTSPWRMKRSFRCLMLDMLGHLRRDAVFSLCDFGLNASKCSSSISMGTLYSRVWARQKRERERETVWLTMTGICWYKFVMSAWFGTCLQESK